MKFLLLLMAMAPARAQSTAQELADSVVQQWAGKSAQRFKGLSQVIHGNDTKATLLLSGVQRTGNSGDDTILGMDFSGMYEASLEGQHWKVDRQIPLDEMGQIVRQQLRVVVRPGHGIDVEDRMRVRVKGGNGFVARLNHQAKLAGTEPRHQFGGGLLWVDLPDGETEFTLRYSLEVERAPDDPNSGCFQDDFGHVRNQYFWHPAFGFSNTGDQADFQIEVRIPKDYRLTTSLPQSEHVEGEERMIEGKSVQHVFTLTLAYDRGWSVSTEKAGRVRLELFLTPDFRPEPAAVAGEFRQIHTLLAGRFGEPDSDYIAVIQLRARKGNGYFASNQGIFIGGSPGSLSMKDGYIAASLGHEVSHLWTQGSGPMANFLREGWATYAESLVVEMEFGRDTLQRFWRQEAREYFDNYDGKASMWGSGNGSNLNYGKGGWMFRMLEEAVGRESFEKGMAEFSRRSLAGSSDFETLVECFRRPDFDAAEFLLPWAKEKRTPRLRTQVDGRTVTIFEDGPVFALPVTLEGKTAQGSERKRVWIRGNQTEVLFTDAVADVRIDPDEVLLLKR